MTFPVSLEGYMEVEVNYGWDINTILTYRIEIPLENNVKI